MPNFRLNSCLMFSMATMSWHNFTPTTKGNQEKVVTLNLISRIIAYFLDWTHHPPLLVKRELCLMRNKWLIDSVEWTCKISIYIYLVVLDRHISKRVSWNYTLKFYSALYLDEIVQSFFIKHLLLC